MVLAFSRPVLVNLVRNVPTFVQPGVGMMELANQDIQFTGDILACGRRPRPASQETCHPTASRTRGTGDSDNDDLDDIFIVSTGALFNF